MKLKEKYFHGEEEILFKAVRNNFSFQRKIFLCEQEYFFHKRIKLGVIIGVKIPNNTKLSEA